MQKHEILKDNLDRAVANSKESYKKINRKDMPKEQQDKERKQFRQGAVEAEKSLPRAWNPEIGNSPDTDKRPMFGCYFGGVNFDKDGKVIR